jgi:MYXO-CTERM domain-containing protein
VHAILYRVRAARPQIVMACLFAIVAVAAEARAFDEITTPFPGGTLKHHVEGGQDLWVLRLDLCAAGVRVRGTAEGERGRRVSRFAADVGAQAAINGDFFSLDGAFQTDGPAAHDGAIWGGPNHTYVAPISFGSAHVDFPLHDLEGATPPWAREIVSGHPTLLHRGAVVGSPGDPLCTNRNPRTVLGLTEDHRTLIVMVVDGRRAGAAGMTCDELAFVMALEGAHDAVALDGGGSATMVVNGAVQNRPSDGSERTVGNHLAFYASGSGAAPHCPDYIDPLCRGDRNFQACEGSVVTSCSEGAPVLAGDCGFFGAPCSTAGGLAHCVHPYCPANLEGGEQGGFCLDATRIGTCELGRFSEGDCGAFGATCSEAGPPAQAHCVHFLCNAELGAEDGAFCRDGATLGVCTLGAYAERACTGGCVETSSTLARCGEDPPPDAGPADAGGSDGGDVLDGGRPARGDGSIAAPLVASCGCRVVGGGRRAPLAALGWLGVAVAVFLRRRAR